MLEYFKNNRECEFFAEKRLIFQNKPEKSGKKLSPRQSSKQRLDNFRKRTPLAPSKETYSESHVHSRISKLAEEINEENVDLLKRRAKLKGKMEARETRRMQGTHEKLYTQYMNPNFMMYMRSKGFNDQVFPILDLIMKHPSDFEYVPKPNNVLHIVKRTPYNKRPSEIDDNFLVVMEEDEGHISKVRNKKFNENFKVDHKIPWMSNTKFNKKMELYNKQWKSDRARYKDGEAYQKLIMKAKIIKHTTSLSAEERRYQIEKLSKEYKDIKKESYETISGDLKDIHVAMNIDFPQRFIDMVEARNLDFEKADRRIMDVKTHQGDQGTTYDAITKNAYGTNGKLRVVVIADPELDGIYQIYTRDYGGNPLRVNKRGEIMRPNPDGSWSADLRYTSAVRRKYYKANTDAEIDLKKPDGTWTPDKIEMDRINAEDTDTSPTAQRANDLNEFVDRREEVDQKLFSRKDRVSLLKLREIVKEISTRKSPEFTRKVNKITKRKRLQDAIKEMLDSDVPKLDQTRNDKADVML